MDAISGYDMPQELKGIFRKWTFGLLNHQWVAVQNLEYYIEVS